MLNREKTGFVGLGALGLSLVFALQAPVAWGQATDLVCVGCVQGTDIQDGTIGPNKLIPGSINATTIANGVIGPNKLIPGSINTSTIANDAIRSNKILDGAVRSADILDGDVRSVDIQDGGVTSVDIQDNTITQNDIATNGVGPAEIATNAVGQTEIAAGGVASSEVLDNSLTQNDLATNSVGAAEIAVNAVGQSEIATNGVAGSEVQNSSLSDFDIADEAGVDFLNDTGLGSDISVTTAWGVMRNLSVTAPTSGFVTCIAAGHADWEFQSQRRQLEAGWDNTGGTTAPDSYNRLDLTSPAGNTDHRVPMTSMHTFSVSGGTTTFSLKARCLSCAVNEMDYNFHSAACMFFPTRY